MGAPRGVAVNNNLYIGGRTAAQIPFTIQKFNMLTSTWSTVPLAPVGPCGLGRLSGKLIAIGGRPVSHFDPNLPDAAISADVFTFHSKTQRWQNDLPSLCHPRLAPTCVSGSSFIVAAGGISGSTYAADVIRFGSAEVFERGSSRWILATASLPFASDYISSAVFKNNCFFLGGLEGMVDMLMSGKNLDPAQQATTGVFHLSLAAPHQSLPESSKQPQPVVAGKWKPIPDSPLVFPLAATLGDSLLALGGNAPSGLSSAEDSKKMHVYSPLTGSWLHIGSAPVPLTCEYPASSVAMQLSENEFVVLAMNYVEQDGYRLYKCTLSTED